MFEPQTVNLWEVRSGLASLDCDQYGSYGPTEDTKAHGGPGGGAAVAGRRGCARTEEPHEPLPPPGAPVGGQVAYTACQS